MNAVRAASAQRTFHSAALRASLPSPPLPPPLSVPRLRLLEFKQSKEKDHRAHMNRVGSSCLGLGSSNKTPVPRALSLFRSGTPSVFQTLCKRWQERFNQKAQRGKRERWVLLKIPRCDIDGLGEEQ